MMARELSRMELRILRPCVFEGGCAKWGRQMLSFYVSNADSLCGSKRVTNLVVSLVRRAGSDRNRETYRRKGVEVRSDHMTHTHFSIQSSPYRGWCPQNLLGVGIRNGVRISAFLPRSNPVVPPLLTVD